MAFGTAAAVAAREPVVSRKSRRECAGRDGTSEDGGFISERSRRRD
jgi:hypothetical protein